MGENCYSFRLRRAECDSGTGKKADEKIDITFLCHQWVTVASMAAVPGVEDELSVEATFFFKRTQSHLWR